MAGSLWLDGKQLRLAFLGKLLSRLRKKKNALKIQRPNGTSLGKSAPLVVAFTSRNIS